MCAFYMRVCIISLKLAWVTIFAIENKKNVIKMSKSESLADIQYTKVPAEDNNKPSVKEEQPAPYGYGIRHVQLIIYFLCLTMSFIARGHLGVTLVVMTSQQSPQTAMGNIKDIATKVNELHDSNYTLDRNFTSDTEEKWTVYRTYDWPKPIQEMVLMAFFLGYCLMLLPVSLICQRWGGKLPIEMSIYINGVVSILTPWLTLWGGWKAACMCRVIQGLAQAGTLPAIQTLLAQWVPESERATMSSYTYTGTTAGTVIGFQLGGLLSASWGWPAAFWVIGVLCLLTGAFLTIFGASSPSEHKKISVEEKLYIIGSSSQKKSAKKRRAPWRAILTSKPVWGSFITHVGSGVSFVFIFTQVPSYIHYILGINVKSSGLLSSLPYLFSFVTSLFFGIISDFFTNRKIVSLKNARRISNTISQVGLAVSLICTSYASSTTAAVACLVLAMCFQMGIYTGWWVNHIDLSPNYSGTLMAIGSTLMHIFVLVLPILVSNIVLDVRNPFQWRIMIYLIAGIAFSTNLVFVFLMSSDVQPWNECDPTSEEADDLKIEAKGTKENETKHLK